MEEASKQGTNKVVFFCLGAGGGSQTSDSEGFSLESQDKLEGVIEDPLEEAAVFVGVVFFEGLLCDFVDGFIQGFIFFFSFFGVNPRVFVCLGVIMFFKALWPYLKKMFEAS